jgi:heme-degrading monooxygenase HmoA
MSDAHFSRKSIGVESLPRTRAVRDIDETRSEIVTLSWWTSLDAIRAFAGEPPDRARYFPEDSEYLLTRPDYARHYRSSDIG